MDDPLLALTDKDRTKYLIEVVTKVWNESFDTRQQMLVYEKNKKITIRYDTYLNTFICLESSIGLELVSLYYFVFKKYTFLKIVEIIMCKLEIFSFCLSFILT